MTIHRGYSPKYRCSNPSCRKIHDNRNLAQECCPEQQPSYHFTHPGAQKIGKVEGAETEKKDQKEPNPDIAFV